MSLKAKLVTSISAFALVLALLIVGVFAVNQATINMGGSISFKATDVNATVVINVEGTAANDESDDKTFTFNADTDEATADWTGKNWTFDDTRTITVTVTVTNKDTVRSLTSTFTAPEDGDLGTNLSCSTQTQGEKTVVAGGTVTYTMTFTVTDENASVSAAAWTAKLVLANVAA